MQANITKIEWDSIFNKYFNFNKNQMILKDTSNKIIIYKEDMDNDEECDDDTYLINKFFINTKGEEIEFVPPIPLMINEEIIENLDDCYNKEIDGYILSKKNLVDSENILYYIIENNGLSASLLEIKYLIEKDSYIKEHTINETYQHFIDLIDNSGIKINFVHIELILREMLYLFNNDRTILKESEEFPEYTIYNISNAIQFGSESVSKTLAFEQIYKQLMTDSYGTLGKNKKSIIDYLIK